MNALVRCLAGAAFGAVLSVSLAGPAVAGDAPCKSLGYVQKRVVEKADQGIDALRDYVFITRGIHQIDMAEVAASLDDWRASARCAKVAAERSAGEPVALESGGR
jgi:hypothetical protein